ncbi:MAG: crossover junction endodeoxyribonuclease RuvC [Deltaproteobacteria bacterium]|nr:crossover junction endodeoxyribonuclease RuvC [Deltaproteobacteria bacterium]
MRVLGIDPGTVNTGWGVVDGDGSHLVHKSSGVILCRGPLSQRLLRIFEELKHIFDDHAPQCISLEKTFVGDNVQSAFRLGEARGAILVAAAQAGVTVCEYAPAEIKVAVAGSGRAAKEQMQIMVARLLGIPDTLAPDQADALGAAICHLHTSRFAARVGDAVALEALSRRRRRSLRR